MRTSKPNSLVADLGEVSKAADRDAGAVSIRLLQLGKMLRRVVRALADEGLRVDRQPGLALRPQHIACMQSVVSNTSSDDERGSSVQQAEPF